MKKFLYVIPMGMLLSVLLSCTGEELPGDLSEKDSIYATDGGSDPDHEDPPTGGG